MGYLSSKFFLTHRQIPVTIAVTGIFFVMLYHCRFLNPRLKNLMCKSEFSVLF